MNEDPMDIRNEAAMRGLLLSVLYGQRAQPWQYVKPESFSPPWTLKDIKYFGKEFHGDKLVMDSPELNSPGTFRMRISLRGKAVWERRDNSRLDIALPRD